MSTISQGIRNLAGVSPKAKALSQNDNDVVIVAAVRSAITKVCATSNSCNGADTGVCGGVRRSDG